MRAWVLTSRATLDEDATEVADGVYLSASPSAIRTALQSPPGQDMKVLVGYAGWSAGQLDEELAQSSWLPAPVGADVPPGGSGVAGNDRDYGSSCANHGRSDGVKGVRDGGSAADEAFVSHG